LFRMVLSINGEYFSLQSFNRSVMCECLCDEETEILQVIGTQTSKTVFISPWRNSPPVGQALRIVENS
jgi:hypothetical protein